MSCFDSWPKMVKPSRPLFPGGQAVEPAVSDRVVSDLRAHSQGDLEFVPCFLAVSAHLRGSRRPPFETHSALFGHAERERNIAASPVHFDLGPFFYTGETALEAERREGNILMNDRPVKRQDMGAFTAGR